MINNNNKNISNEKNLVRRKLCKNYDNKNNDNDDKQEEEEEEEGS